MNYIHWLMVGAGVVLAGLGTVFPHYAALVPVGVGLAGWATPQPGRDKT